MKFKQLMLGVMLWLVAGLTSTSLVAQVVEQPTAMETYMSKVCRSKCVDPVLLLDYVLDTAKDLDLDPYDLLAIMQVESSFKPEAANRGNVGLMQVNLRYHAKKFKTSPYNVQANTQVGGSIYKACLIKRKGNKALAFRCYNSENVKNMIYPNKVLKARADLMRSNVIPAPL